MKKMILIILAAGLFAVGVGCGGSDVPVPVAAPAQDVPVAEPVPLPDVVEELPGDVIEGDGSDIIFDGDIILPGEGEDFNTDTTIPEYLFISGTIEAIEEVDSYTHITIQDTNGNPAVLVLAEDVVFPFSDTFDVGDEVTGWYLSNAPMIMIWPPQYNIVVLSAGMPDGSNIKVDRFHKWEGNPDGMMISQDEMFAFSVDANTEIILEDGQDFSDFDFELNRRMVVIYGISTRSIPEMATADKLIVLFETAIPLQ